MDKRAKGQLMKAYDPIQWFVIKRIEADKRLKQARVLAESEKQATERFDVFYEGKCSFRDEVDTKELNSFMSLP